MKKLIGGIVLFVVVLSGAAFWVWSEPVSGTGVPAAPPGEILAPIQANAQTIAEGRVVPVRAAALSVPINGLVAEIRVAEGDAVEAGQVLLRLDSARQNADMVKATAELRHAEAQLEELRAGARTQEIEAAEALLASAQARYDRLTAGPLQAEIAAAQSALAAANAELQRVREGQDSQQIIAAEADLSNAEAERNQAQAAYDQEKWRNDIAQLPESVRLQQATNNYEAAAARLESLRRGPSAADIASAQARVQEAQANLDMLTAVHPADIAAVTADVSRYQAELDLLKAGVRPETIAVAQVAVVIAEANLKQTLAALGNTVVRAPFAGTVAALSVEVGEQALAGTPILHLAELSTWQIETEDLTEFDIVDIAVGDEVSLDFDAIPDLSLTGRVAQIRAIGEDKQGDITYTVIVEPDQFDDRLRWNMTSVLTFPLD